MMSTSKKLAVMLAVIRQRGRVLMINISKVDPQYQDHPANSKQGFTSF